MGWVIDDTTGAPVWVEDPVAPEPPPGPPLPAIPYGPLDYPYYGDQSKGAPPFTPEPGLEWVWNEVDHGWQQLPIGRGTTGSNIPTSPDYSGAPSSGAYGEAAPGVTYPPFEPPSFDVGPFVAPAPFEYPAFEGPTAETFRADPGYEFTRKEGLRALENAASAQGLLRSGATAKGLMDYSQSLADQSFGNVYNRQQNEWLMGRATAADDYDRLWRNTLTSYLVPYQTEQDEYTRALQTYGANIGTAFGVAGLQNDRFGQLLSLYDLSTRSLPRYTPMSQNPESYGFTY